ncbi:MULTISPECIES: polyribonucleotide nucleotidyltransferase [unclassified Pseudomonas]|uniref:polyribonucleotide nucleotidyltransferase n=1 Tax=unclassified Pseudomonas TaxID=196821 RepID=UPI0038510648
MRLFTLKSALMCTALTIALGITGAQAATDAKHPAKSTKSAHTAKKTTPAKPTGQKVSMLGGKFVFFLPKDYVKGPMEEIDDKAKAAGVTGSLYMNKPAKRVVIITETPLPEGNTASSNDTETLDNIIAETLVQQQSSYKDFTKLGEKKLVRKGLGLRQLDISGSVDGGKVLSTTVAAASGTRTAMVNVISLAKDAKAHGAVVKGVTGSK